jgi:tyrosine-protein kinase Etk/Wzc
MSKQNSFTEDEPNKTIDIQKLLVIVLARWKVIAISLFLSLTVAYIQLRYTKPLYKANTSLKFEDEKGGQVSDLFKYGRISGRIENIIKTETEVLKSRTMSRKTLQYLGLTTSEFIEGNFITSRLYPNKAFSISFIKLDSSDIGKSFGIIINENRTFSLLEGKQKRNYNYGDTILVYQSYLVISALNKDYLNSIRNQPVQIIINNLETFGASIASSLEVELEKNTNIINLSYTSDIAEFATDYVNSIAQVYIKESVNSKTEAAKQTIRYIDDQLVELASRVANSQKNLSDFKSGNKGMNPQELGKAEFTKLLDLETNKNILLMRKTQLASLEKEVIRTQNKPVELLVVDASDAQAISTLISLLNNYILERITYMGKYNTTSPIMKDNEQKINELKAGISRAIKAVNLSLDNQLNKNTQLIEELNGSLSNLPEKEQALFNLERSFKINEKIYGYLQERRLENMIGISSIVSNISIIDPALYNHNPISPKPDKNYLIALLIGLSIGFGYIFVSRFLYDKIPDKETIESLSNVPVIGVIKKIEEEEKQGEYGIYVYKNPKSIFAESIRGIRTNANFILKGEKNKIISITSSVSGEGKTFCTINIAASVTQRGFKVVIVGCDLRRPKLHESFPTINNKIGLTSLLVKRASIDDIIFETEHENLFVIPAGPTPPNPSELLQTDEFNTFIAELKTRFDYVFLDTAPVGLVSDSFALMAKADLNFFIIRAQYSKREFATTPDRIIAENNIKNVYTILNSYDQSAFVYSSLYKQEYGDHIGGGGYYHGGYYGKGRYSGYNNYNELYYSGYYSDEGLNKKKKKTLFSFFNKRKK